MMDIDNKELKKLLESILYIYGYDFTEYAEASVIRRINNFMITKKIETMEKLGKMILQDEKLFEEFVQHISVTVTEMFRDPSFYKSLRENVMGRLATYPFIKIWVAGCATGEEVYSIAILLKEEGLLNRSVIYATDINQKSLQIAKEGIYALENMKSHTTNYQKSGGVKSFSEYYKAKYNSVIFDKSLKQNIVFSPHNLAVDRSFNEFQLIICRNVLIYFNQQLQNNVISLFYESLCTLGFLGLGSKESLLFSENRKHFGEIDRKEKIFVKKQ
ncbi:MAG TPA: protein-glutamate O-methyltransferase CheR [Cytophagaceae bacterium]|nr:protein-glutamate O-methyltransferase CheR [Cytophagaceae bacterium]